MKTQKIHTTIKPRIQSSRQRKPSPIFSFGTSILLISCFMSLCLLAIPTSSHAQLGLLRKLGKVGSKAAKAGKAGKLGRLGRPARAIASGAGLYYADDILRLSTNKLDEFVGVISKNGEGISLRSNFKSTEGLNLAEATLAGADEGVEALVKRHVKKRGGKADMTEDAFSEVFKEGMEFVVDASLLEDDEYEEYELSDLPGLKVRCSDGWVRPFIEKGDKKWVVFQEGIPVFILLENEALFSQMPPLNTLIVDPADLRVQAIDSLAKVPILDASSGKVYLDEFLREKADSLSWWEMNYANNQLLATFFTALGPSYSLKLPSSWIVDSNLLLRQSPKPQNDPPVSWILGGLIIMILGFWGLMKVFQKAGRYGMEGTVPFYNLYRMFEMAGLPGKQALWLLVPFYNIYVHYQFTGKFAAAFGQEQKWLHVLGTLFPPALWAYLGFLGSVYYEGPEGYSDMYAYDGEEF